MLEMGWLNGANCLTPLKWAESTVRTRVLTPVNYWQKSAPGPWARGARGTRAPRAPTTRQRRAHVTRVYIYYTHIQHAIARTIHFYFCCTSRARDSRLLYIIS